MSIIHVNQISTHILRAFANLIDVSDLKNHSEEMLQNFRLTRCLAAYATQHLAGATPEISAASITDAGNDNGIDVLHFDEANKRLYIIQSKWIKNGSGEPENGDIKKFVAGVRDLFNLHFERFNAKVKNKQSMIANALNDPLTRYEVGIGSHRCK